jgi:hypothetical protein
MNNGWEAKIAGIPAGSRVSYGTGHRRRGTLVSWGSGRNDEHFATIDNDYGFREDARGDDVELAPPDPDTTGPLYGPGGVLHLQICPTKLIDEHQGLVCYCRRRAPRGWERHSW